MVFEAHDFERISALIVLHKTGEISPAGQSELDSWLKMNEKNQVLFDELCSTKHLIAELDIFRSFDSESKLATFHKKRHKKSALKLGFRIAIAATIILITGIGLFLFNLKNNELENQIQAVAINPGKHGATLVLSNGQKIRLADAANGKITTESGVSVIKTADGKLIYEVKGSVAESNKFNTIYTDKGETYQLKLSDGSLIWLNAASSLTYNTSLNSNGKRVVKLDGEAYFEVFKDKQHPFVVKTDRQDVEVLGTHFNINSYKDEAITNTTLLEGAVKINDQLILKPNEQASLYKNGELVVSGASENAVAWKDGNFVFEKENIESIMRKVARWYNVEIVYAGERPKELYSGITKRSSNVSQILSMLEKTGTVNFKIEGNKIILSKN